MVPPEAIKRCCSARRISWPVCAFAPPGFAFLCRSKLIDQMVCRCAVQDEMLGEIEKGVDRVLTNAQTINQEAKIHTVSRQEQHLRVHKQAD